MTNITLIICRNIFMVCVIFYHSYSLYEMMMLRLFDSINYGNCFSLFFIKHGQRFQWLLYNIWRGLIGLDKFYQFSSQAYFRFLWNRQVNWSLKSNNKSPQTCCPMSTRQPEHSALHWWSAPHREYYLAQMWRQSSSHTEAPQCPIETMIRPNHGYYHCSYSYLPLALLPSSGSKEQPAPCELSAEVEECTVVPVVVGRRGGVTQLSAWKAWDISAWLRAWASRVSIVWRRHYPPSLVLA